VPRRPRFDPPVPYGAARQGRRRSGRSHLSSAPPRLL